jgi:hypothetical protein
MEISLNPITKAQGPNRVIHDRPHFFQKSFPFPNVCLPFNPSRYERACKLLVFNADGIIGGTPNVFLIIIGRPDIMVPYHDKWIPFVWRPK